MGIASSIRRRYRVAFFRSTNLPALIAFVVLVAAGILAEYQGRQVHTRDLRAQVLAQASLVRARLEGKINANIQLVRGLVATLATEPEMSQQRFSALSSNLFGRDSQLSHIAAAPGLVIRLIYPLEGNERAIGLDYRSVPDQLEPVLRARDTGALVLAGPVDLVQGGHGLIGRFPVFTGPGEGRFWGIVSAVIQLERLYADTGLTSPDLPLQLAIFGRDAQGAHGERFFGAPEIARNHPVEVDVAVPNGNWRIAAVPKGGWDAHPYNPWPLRAIMFVAGALILVPIFATGQLIEERQRHIGELRRRERQLRRLSRRHELALATSRVGVWEMNLDNRTLFWDERQNELYGYPATGERSYSSWADRLHPDDLQRAAEEFRVAVEEAGRYNSEYRLLLPGGDIRHIKAIGTVYRDPGEPARIVGVNWDVTADKSLNEDLTRAKTLTEARNRELEAAKERIEHNSLHNSLTGLANRRYLDETLADHAARFDATGEIGALLHIDLDRFKQINDTLGHAAGDAILVHVAEALRALVAPGDLVARVGGDEFVVVRRWRATEKVDGVAELTGLAERIIERLQQPIAFEGHECRIGASIGIATDSDAVADPRRLLVNADIALYRAKGRGRNRHQFFNEALQAEIVTTKRLADEILSGVERAEFVPHYQPQFCAETLDVIGVEALARWNHPAEGLLAPAAFMKIAEELNVVDMIDRMILEQVLADRASWARNGVKIPKASVNVSARRLHDEELIRSLRGLDIEPGTISFELVESIFLDEQDELVAWNVDHIKELGIDVEIDDFGTGYASIVSLMKLKPSRLKIDRQLILPIVHSPAQRQLVGSIIDIGRSLGIEVLAEGVETIEHARILNGLGCGALQGYAFARAMSSGELVDFLKASAWRRAS